MKKVCKVCEFSTWEDDGICIPCGRSTESEGKTMNMKEATQIILDECGKFDSDVEIAFDRNEVTIYWKSLRIDCNATTFPKAVKLIHQLEAMGARCE